MNRLDEANFCNLVQEVAYALGYTELVCVCGITPWADIKEVPLDVGKFIYEAVDEKLGRTPASNDEVPSVDSA